MQQDDLLKIYAKSNLVSFYSPIVVMGAFIATRIWIYGLPLEQPVALFREVLISSLLLVCSFIMFMGVRQLYQQVLSSRQEQQFDVRSSHRQRVMRIAVFYFLYMCPWLYFLFMPLQGLVYEHLLGYFFVFCAIGIYATTSSGYFPLLLWDIGVPMAFALVVTWINRGAPETPYIFGVLSLFSLYALGAGYKNARTTESLVESRRAHQKAAQDAQRATNAKSDFLATMSHEIRTPMTGILGMIDFLSETDLSKDQKYCVANITECSKTLLNTLNDILDLSRIEAGKLAINNTNMDIHAVAENVINILRTVAEEKKLTLSLHIDENVPQHIYSDPHRIRQSIMNLVNNALKFTEKGSVNVTLSFQNNVIRVAVRDTGIGISAENLQHLFSTFAQVDNSITRQYGGSGLGLSITKRLVEMLDGHIHVTSELGTGSTFWFELPYRAPMQSKRQEEIITEYDIPPKNILLVEDNLLNQTICRRLLEKKGHHVTVAGDGNTAIEQVQQGTFDLIFMDCSLPGKSGIDTARQIKAMGEKYQSIPIIALTANGMEAQISQCLEAGMADCILKPYEPARMHEVMARHLGYAIAPAKPPSEDKLKSIEDEMGPEYVRFLVLRSIAESSRLLSQISHEHKNLNYTAVMQSAHELRAVCGTIGMKKTQETARQIEEACIHGDHGSLPGLIHQLDSAEDAERSALEKYYESN